MGSWGAKRKRSAPVRYGARKYGDSVLASISKSRRDAASLGKLRSTVATVKRQLSTVKNTLYFRCGAVDVPASSIAGTAVSYLNLTKYSNWQPTFGTDAGDVQGKQACLKSIKLDYTFGGWTEKDAMEATVYVLRLREEAANDINTSGDFVASPWPTQDADYSYEAASAISERPGLASGYWNPRKYSVLYKRRVQFNQSGGVPNTVATSGNVVGSAINTGKNLYHGSKVLTFGKSGILLKGAVGYNTVANTSDWKNTLHPLDVKNNLYFVVASNDLTGDAQSAYWSMNALITVEA